MSRGVSHERVRQLLAARLDGRIDRNDQRVVAEHLRTCPQCRAVDHDYRAQRAQLRTLAAPIPPRDLWPRTSAALDREVARSRGRFARRRPTAVIGRQAYRARHSAALAGLVTALAVVMAVATFQIMPNLGSSQPGESALPTPFSVADQQLAFVGGGAENLSVYRTQINRMCPTDAPDCVANEGITSTPISLPSGVKPRNVALSPSGNQLVLVGEDVGRDVFAVVLLPNGDTAGVTTPGSSLVEPATNGGVSSRPPISVAGGGQPSSGAGDLQTPSSNGASPSLTPQTSPGTASGGSNVPPPTALSGLTVLSILDGVHSAGAPPAWSADGSMLAFSAMPADGSQGPDIYVWQPSDTRARALTNDHESFFASWSGTRIVASRLLNDPTAASPQVATVVIDPQTLAEQVVDGPQMWLPVVNAGSDAAVVWYGQLAWNGSLPTPAAGSLYLADWSALEPAVDDTGTGSPTSPPTTPVATAPPGEPSTSPAAASAPARSAGPPDTPAAPPAGGSLGTEVSGTSANHPSPPVTPAASPSADESSSPIGGSLIPGGAGSSLASSPSASLPAVLSQLDLTLLPNDQNVIDWQVRWSSDGQVLGIWIADVAGSSWGNLVVLALDPQTAQLAVGTPLVAPTLARRGFTLGLSRVAFVAPSDQTPDGELRVRTWGSTGTGDLHLRAPEVEGVVPAF